jgi:ATP-dependent Clp protease ATP-binding subunit ClpC
MAVTYRFPVLVWRDHDGWYTASLLEWDEPAGIGRSAAHAVEQLEDYLGWCYTEKPWLSPPDFLDPRLVQFKVQVRPEYQEEGRRYPCAEPVSLRVYCVHGRQEQGLLVCVLPTLGLRFYYYEEGALKTLVPHYVQQHLEGQPPQALARHQAPTAAELDQVVVSLSNREPRQRDWEPSLATLEQVAEPLGDPRVRKQFVRPWERDQQVADLVRRLGQEKVNILLVGEAGCGKTTVLVEAVRLLERSRNATEGIPYRRERPPWRSGADPDEDESRRSRPKRRYWLTSGARLIAGMKYLGQWEERCEQVLAELGQAGGVLCVDNLLDLVREGGTSPTDSVAAFFLPYLQRGELRLVGEATPAELDACRRLSPGFADVFQVLRLEPFSRPQAINVLDHLSAMLGQNHHLDVGRGLTDLVYHLFRRFAPYQAFPGRAAAFLGRLFDKVRQQKKREVGTAEAVAAFIGQTGLPELFLRDELPLARPDVVEAFRKPVIGQKEAVQAAADLVMTFKAGLNDPNRPVGVLLFCGPTGVGKTELARALARYFFGHGEGGDRLVRLDMSEYAGPGAALRLLAQPDGRPSDFIRKVREQPFVVLLLDEIEKADAEVFDVLLGVFDEGRLTDRYGRLTTFRSAVIVMTSNLGAGKQESFGFGERRAVQYQGEALAFFRPEFFNRIDAVVTFQPLGPETIRAITRKELADIAAREGLARLGVRVAWSDALVEHLAKEGFDARYGARPLQRTLETLVVTPLARYLLDHAELRNATVTAELGASGTVSFRTDF